MAWLAEACLVLRVWADLCECGGVGIAQRQVALQHLRQHQRLLLCGLARGRARPPPSAITVSDMLWQPCSECPCSSEKVRCLCPWPTNNHVAA